MQVLVERAVADARAYERGGMHALVMENFGDVPFTKGRVAPETVAAMAVAASSVRMATNLPLGFNVLRNDPQAALALCAACEGGFIRVNVHVGAMVTDQGVIEGDAYGTLRCRRALDVDAEIFADVHVKHAAPLANLPIGLVARDAIERGLADALIVSGTGTGAAPDLNDLKAVREACPRARILIGSGATAENVRSFLRWADGVIVGSTLKMSGRVAKPVDQRRVAAFTRAATRA